jgi:pimeloyl-ACP methyl ester carboxylesterase
MSAVRDLSRAFASSAALLLLLTGGSAATLRHEPRFERAPSCPAELPALKTARCGFLVVPENRSHPHGRTIRLAVAVVPAVAERPAPEPLVYLEGGPGGSAFLESQRLVDAGFNRNHDLVLVDQRGALYSEPSLACPVIDEFNLRALSLRSVAESTRRRHVAATRACRKRLVAEGVDLAAYNTTENAADIADLRRALGYERWNVFGVSYGTNLALALMRDHPDGIRSVVLDSVVPAQAVKLPGFWPNARAAFDELFDACAAQARCRSSYPRLEHTFTRLVNRLEADPVRTTVREPQSGRRTRVLLDGSALANWLVSLSLVTPLLRNVPAWVDELAAGGPRGVAATRVVTVAPPGLVAYGLVYGVVCSEWYPFATERQVLAEAKRVLPRYPTSVLAEPPQFTFMFDDCRAWDVPAAPASVLEPPRSGIPTLILSGSFDAITSFAWAEIAAVSLPNSGVVRIPGVGHFVAADSECARSVMASFLARPDAPDTGCVASLEPPAFVTR